MSKNAPFLRFESKTITATLRTSRGKEIQRPIEVRTNPITGRKCRITLSRSLECEPGTDSLPPPPPDADRKESCPFCPKNIEALTPRLHIGLDRKGRLRNKASILFPNLFPYGAYSAVSLFDENHFVEIGTADSASYADSFVNCVQYLKRVIQFDPKAQYMAITQNHLPAAGGSLVHPHLQVHADTTASNQHVRLLEMADRYHDQTGRLILSDYLKAECSSGQRIIGSTGHWHWLAAFAPEGFFELWGIYPGRSSFFGLAASDWADLSVGILNAQRYFRSQCRNSYNLGMLCVEKHPSNLELRVVLTVRANFAPWVRNDITGYEVMLGDMATFNLPEETAKQARDFWNTC